MIRFLASGALLLALTACDSIPTSGAASDADLRAELVPAEEDMPPTAPAGACWAKEVTPAVIETVSEQEMIRPAQLAEDGTQISPAVFRSVTRQKIVQDRQTVFFRKPCGADGNITFTASLQRALKARGLYSEPVTGEMNEATRLAIRRYQEPRGLDSKILSLAAARDLGLVAVDRDSLS
ncbi:peptidoglycan-binding protein [Tabrizicola sp. J26]|uniref:peptidoglycan-binding domain-containing protein n=1 Tax=Alitabrizicola rongguiensis TaxID=2909234 RepID=UPI001F2ABD0A|nr:peptidoglycan-binding domain-containing protein [Tabrizicola rongguiensis]MCF1709028.1 peptidoglycan-binding protein [Tabrizicola rongguiensis]